MKKILVPIDFSDASLGALQVAAHLALSTKAEISLLYVNEMVLYVLPVSEYAYGAAVIDLDNYNEQALNKLQEIKSRYFHKPEYNGLHVKSIVKDGSFVTIVKEIVESEGYNLIVMGTLGATGWKEAFIGSNTERVIRYASCPVLVIPEGIERLNLKKVLVASTLKVNQENMFITVKELRGWFDFEVEILYMNNPLQAMTPESIESEKNYLMQHAGLREVKLHTIDHTIDEEVSILNYAKEIKADLILMATHQRKGISHLMFGSITEDTANHTPIPVLSVPID
jgi:nucleotide-binding universal stress UspA family protein